MRIKLLSCFTAMMLSAVCLNAQNYELVWSDEFDGTELNREVWNYETGTGTDGWGNWEKQYYTDRKDNVNVADGKLTITCKKEAYNGSQYTSGRIQTRNKVMFKYGKIESLIKVPMGASGVWPAFWMLGTGHGGAWPYCGEIDIMEMMCKADNATWNEALTTYHWNTQGISGDYSHGSHGLGYKYGEELGAKWRVYGLEWTPTLMTGYVCDADGSNRHDICSLDISSHEGGMEAFTDYEFYIVYNFAFGGTYVNNEIDNSWTGDNMQVDWVRVYQDLENEPSSTTSIGNFTPKVNTDYIKVLSDREFDGSVLDLSASPFYIWEGTMKAHEADAFEGEGVIGLENCGQTWYGAGYNYSASTIDYTNLRNYTLHFALKTNMNEPFQLNCNKGNTTITPSKINEWEEFDLPVATTFPTIQLGQLSSFEPFTFNQAAGNTMSGRTFYIDDVYFYMPGGSKEPNITISQQIGKLKDKNAKAKFVINGSNLSGDVTITSSNTRDFKLLTTNITPVDGKVNQEIEVEFIGNKTSATKLTVTCGDIIVISSAVSSISSVERLTTDYIILSRDEEVDGSFRDWSGETINVWENEWTDGPTMTAGNVTPYEGDNCMSFVSRDKGWYGGGFVVNQKLDYEYFNRYTLHFAFYSSTTNPTTIRICGSDVQITPKAANTWEVFEFPMWKFNFDFDVKSTFEPFSFCQGSGEPAAEMNGKVIAFDDVYYYIPDGSGVKSLSCTSEVLIDTRHTQTGSIRVSGSSLGEGAKVTLVSSNPNFELSANSFNAINGRISENVTVTFKGTGIEYATIVAKCDDLVRTISISSFIDAASSSSCNLINGFTDGGRYYANTWNWVQLTGSTTTINGDGAEFYMPYATTTQFQSQFWLKPTSTLALEAGTKYSVKATLVSDKDATLTFKVVENADNAPAFVEKKISMKAGVAVAINYTGVAIEGLNNESIFFDFGGNQAETKVTVYNVEVGLAECYGDDVVVEEEFSVAVADVAQSNVVIRASHRVVFIENAEGDAQIYDIMGRCIYSGCERQIALGNAGIYIVKVDDLIKKIVIR